MPSALGPYEMSFKSISALKKNEENMRQLFLEPETEDTHPNTKIVRRRTREFMHELDDYGFLK